MASAPSLPITLTQIVGWSQTPSEAAGSRVFRLTGSPEAEELRRVINDYARVRLERRDGWWESPSTAAKRVVQEHNVRCGRGYVVSKLANQLDYGASVLDWAGGTGWTAAMLLKRRPDLNVASLDISDELQQWGQQAYSQPIVYFSGDATDRAVFAAETFDAVIGAECVEHFPDLERALGAARSWLKPGGVLAVTTPNADYWAPEPPAWLMRLAGKQAGVHGWHTAAKEGAGGAGTHANDEHGGHDEIYDQALSGEALAGAMRRVGFASVRTDYTQFAGEWPLQAMCRVLGYTGASAAARVAELVQALSPGALGRKLGFTQVVWAKK